MIKNISNLGDAAIYCDFGKEVNESINSKVISYFNHLKKLVKENKIEGITNLTPSYNKLIISFDLSITNFKKITKILKTLKVINNNQQDSKTRSLVLGLHLPVYQPKGRLPKIFFIVLTASFICFFSSDFLIF